MNTEVLKKVEESQYKKRPNIRIGDTVKLYIKVKEAEKERTQVFEGVVIALKGSGLSSTITVRKISYGVGVEKIFPLHSPVLDKIEVIKRGTVRRAKLYYLRSRVGQKALKIQNIKDVHIEDEKEVAVPEIGTEKEENISSPEAKIAV